MSSDSVPTAPPDVHEEVMRATYRALCRHGFAALTMQDIADEADKSTAVLHYHYETKENLLVAFLAYVLGRFDEQFAGMEGSSATERLRCLFGRLSPDRGWDGGDSENDVRADDSNGDTADDDGDDGDATNGEDRTEFYRALLELRAQAPYREAYREQLRENKESIQAIVADIVADGIERGEFRDVDPETTARFILASLDGARNAAVALDDTEDPPAVRAGLEEFVLSSLRVDDGGATEGDSTAEADSTADEEVDDTEATE
ncbi:transcriptional regulator, TetR family [Halogranum gelatinilyticum]|uniref:Transcriptional regulator, TetR family n=1 Tax=Halogranum gelatinilyticum TaxID=660521 RepID=A0A1G9TQU5_9EURY|nr:TetR family transcriptional regulator C-terminal domain-containing protein [Halogranum gelatinilyticum]SDM49928.1 transcriptional regulator, TetR family [Halogranum gelatinilyticum]